MEIAAELTEKLELKEDLIEFLGKNNLLLILDKIKRGEFTTKEFINFSDHDILELMEEHNKSKFPELRDLVMKLNDRSDALNMLEIINSEVDHT